MLVKTDMTGRWLRDANQAETPIIVLSPYITGDTVSSLADSPAGANIYTLFNSAVFASNSSSLAAITALVKKGRQVFMVDNLHAKVVTDGSSFVTIGSQNLTSRGHRLNKEVTVHLTGENAIASVDTQIQRWIASSTRITVAMVEEMRRNMAALQEQYKQMQALVNVHNLAFDKRVEQRIRIESANDKLRSSLKRQKKTEMVKHGKVCQPGNYRGTTLKFLSDLTQWGSNRERLDLNKRYLCILADGKLGWARLTGRHLTFIARTMFVESDIFNDLPGLSVRLSFNPRALMQMTEECNLVVEFKSGTTFVSRVPMIFTGKKLIMGEAVRGTAREPKGIRQYAHRSSEVVRWVARNEVEFKRRILQEIMTPFEYVDGDKLFGIRAGSFFGGIGTQCQLRLGTLSGHTYFDVEVSPPI
ncbi:phospholipase D-like domain-containing protein [Pseudomonas sp. Pseu.R1]|uniref:phospholipase D-like domain-containing protein n=1 Tax=Pseudomonas sp. Pseu.R1 TaxID=3379818 RepID=UPI003B94E1E8